MQQHLSANIDLNGNQEIKQESNDNIVSIENNKNGDQWSKYKLITWNLWCIPVSSPRCLSNPDRCSTYLRDLADKQEWINYDGLIVVAIQELWCWKTGIFPPFILRLIALLEYIPYIGRFFAALFTILSLLFGVLPILKCLPIRYDPKSRFINKRRRYLPFTMKNNDIPISKFLDNGLLILTNKNPTKWGFQSYTNSACDDSMANKGWLWCYYKHQRLILINTHCQAAGAGHERLLQIKELKQWLSEKWESMGLIEKCVILGDFNVDMESHPIRVQQYDIQQNKPEQQINRELEIIKIEENNKNDIIAESDKKQHTKSGDMVISNQFKVNAYIEKELGDDPLTILRANCKESLADNLRKLNIAKEGGKKTKFTKKAYINIPHHLGPQYHKLNRYEPTFKRAEYNIDHIFVNFECNGVKNKLLALGRYKLSDHRLVLSEFTTD